MNSSLVSLRDTLAQYLRHLSRNTKRLFILTADMVMMPIAFWCAVVVKTESFSADLVDAWWIYALTSILALPVFTVFGLHRMVVRFVSSKTMMAILYAVLIAVTAFAVVARFGFGAEYSASLLFLYGIFASIYVAGSRLAVRHLLRSRRSVGDTVVIYGAGDEGAQLAASMFSSEKFHPIAFLDEVSALQGSKINGLKVYAPSELPRLIDKHEVSKVLLALPTASRRRRNEILTSLEHLPVHVKIMPELADLVSGATQLDDVRDVEAHDLLDRDTVPPDESMLSKCLRKNVIMVTGAGGSIGSELCRQIINREPKKLLLFENNELALYNIDQELKQIKHDIDSAVEIVPLLGCVTDRARLREVMSIFGVDVVYHAAAFKHVPVVERNVINGVLNNVVGTYRCAMAAIDSKVESFVLVSTDKAVNPTNVMGASKRLAELVLQGLDEKGSETRFCMVRFGNVLASSGSVVPLFRQQIKQGGPVTVTHPEIIRYFMTIPEAAQLVIQAGAMAQGGDVFLLDMGKPVKIDDLARRMIHLMGRTVMDEENPEGDIEIRYTGLRPAEKLYEELLIGTDVMGTEHPKIMRAEEKSLSWNEIESVLIRFLDSARSFNVEDVLDLLSQAVEGYSGGKSVVDEIWCARRSREVAAPITPIELAHRKK